MTAMINTTEADIHSGAYLKGLCDVVNWDIPTSMQYGQLWSPTLSVEVVPPSPLNWFAFASRHWSTSPAIRRHKCLPLGTNYGSRTFAEETRVPMSTQPLYHHWFHAMGFSFEQDRLYLPSELAGALEMALMETDL